MTDECHCTTLKSQRIICKPQTVAHLKKRPVELVHVHLVVGPYCYFIFQDNSHFHEPMQSIN